MHPLLRPVFRRWLRLFPRGVFHTCAVVSAVFMLRCGGDSQRLLLIGLDAANWSSMNQLSAERELPVLTRLIREGVAGSLATFVPTASPAIWTTLATGRSPHVHGIALRIFRLDKRGEEEMMAALSSDKRRVPAVWNLCSDHNVPSAFLGWWATWPAEDVEGFVVSDKVREPGLKRTTYPPGLRQELERAGLLDGTLPADEERRLQAIEAQFAAWRRAIEEGSVKWQGASGNVEKYLDDLHERLQAYRRIMAMDYGTERMTHYLMDRDPSLRVIAPYFWYLDVCQHLLWKYWRPEGFVLDPQEQRIFAPLIPDYYRFLDGVVGRLCRHAGRADIVIVSDHGMERSNSEHCIDALFDVEGLLEDMGWLVRRPDGSPDLARSRAYVKGESRQLRLINVSLKGREPDGALPPDRLHHTVDELADALAALRASPSGIPIFKDVRVLTEEEQSYHSGDFVAYVFDQADLVAAVNSHAPLTDSLLTGAVWQPLSHWNRWQPSGSGQHTEGPPGIMILSGPAFRRNVHLQGSRVHDIVPTVLAVLGLPVAEDLEGRVLSEALDPGFASRHPVRAVPTFGLRTLPEADAETPAVNHGLLEQLRALGYVR